MNEVLQKISDIGIVPVIKIEDVSSAVPLAKALIAGGLPLAEITFRTAQAEDAIAAIAKEVPQMLVGAGTVLTIEQADKAIAAGAKFIVSPGFNPKVVAHCIEKGVPITPGCTTCSEIEAALEMGLEVVKFFPAEQSGGLEKIKALAAPYTTLKFIPTGGINEKNLGEYLAFDKVIACGGSFMVKEDFIKNAQWDKITALCTQAVQNMLGLSLAHVGINASDKQTADTVSNGIGDYIGLPVKEGNSSSFIGGIVEVMNTDFLSNRGHVAIGTTSVERAVRYFTSKGASFRAETAKKDDKGRLIAIYFEKDFGGFSFHLVRK